MNQHILIIDGGTTTTYSKDGMDRLDPTQKAGPPGAPCGANNILAKLRLASISLPTLN